MNTNYDKKEFYRAHLARDVRFDGKFFVAVKTTKIYCRPICPARKAKLENLNFYIHAAEAEEAGFRPCLRCRPETAPGSAAWIGTSATVRRAIRIMETTAGDELSISDLASQLGIGERWLRELFQEQVGANPQTILTSKKLDIARNLLDHSTLSITDIAFCSGFQSIRRFNDAFKKRFQGSPKIFRKQPSKETPQALQLSYRPPYAWSTLLEFFSERTLETMERVENNSYERLIRYDDVQGWFKASHSDDNKIKVEFKLNKTANILEFVTRIKNMFDLDADPMAIENGLKDDKKLQPYLKKYSGFRIPGCWDNFELAIRAIVGQKISVKGACTVLNRIVELHGEVQRFDPTLALKKFFPTPEKLATADLSNVGLTNGKINSIKALASLITSGELQLDGSADYEETCQKLLSIKGIGPWTVEYIAMRALKNPDAFPETDLEVQKKIQALKLNPELWSPWRAYATVLLLTISLEQ